MPLYDFYLEWRHESNPWKEAYRAEASEGGTFQQSFLGFFLVFAVLNMAGQFLGKRYADTPITTRPTVLAGTFHALATSAISIYLLLVAPPLDGEEEVQAIDWSLWQKVAMPLSLSYFAADAIWYCLPRSDGLIFFHHIIMCFCHYPVTNDAGATMAGCGSTEWVIWLSVIGYTSEISTVLMNYRWYLLQTLEKDWVGFAIVNILVVISWAYRIILFAYLLIWEIIPRTPIYVEKKQLLTYVIMFLGHAIIGLLSMYWLRIMCRGGLKSLLMFKKKRMENGAASFSFGNDIGRDGCGSGRENDESPGIIQQGIIEATAWVDGTLFQRKEKTT